MGCIYSSIQCHRINENYQSSFVVDNFTFCSRHQPNTISCCLGGNFEEFWQKFNKRYTSRYFYFWVLYLVYQLYSKSKLHFRQKFNPKNKNSGYGKFTIICYCCSNFGTHLCDATLYNSNSIFGKIIAYW